jgi:hypothetical protein
MQTKKIWIGRFTVVVAIVHTAFGLLMGGAVLLGLVKRGVLNTVGNDPINNMVVWFLLFGAVLALLGMAITALERSPHFPSARPLAVGVLLMTTLGVILMPASGFWLMYVAVYGLLRQGPAHASPQLAS